jgi:hypothetical protein
MNDDSRLEARLRSLRPASLPPELLGRMKEPPPGPTPGPWGRMLAATPVAAAAAWLLWWSLSPEPTTPPGEPPALTIHEHRSILVESRPLKFIEHDGRLWELAEETWREEEIALCSTSSLRIQTAETHRQLVCQPVDFD